MSRRACVGLICGMLASVGCLKDNPAHDADEGSSTLATTSTTTAMTTTSTAESGSTTGVDPCADDVNDVSQTADQIETPPNAETLVIERTFTDPADIDWYRYDLGGSDGTVATAYGKLERVPNATLCILPVCVAEMDVAADVACVVGLEEPPVGDGPTIGCCSGGERRVEVELEYSCGTFETALFHQLLPPDQLDSDCAGYLLRYSHTRPG